MPFGHNLFFGIAESLMLAIVTALHARIYTAAVRSNRLRKCAGLPALYIHPKGVGKFCVFLFSFGTFLFSYLANKKTEKYIALNTKIKQ